MNTLTELENLIRQWGHDRNLIAGNTVDRQFTKTWEEVLEIKEAIAAKNDFELADAIGDTVVTLVLLAAIKDWTLQQCVQQAYDTIKNRTGKTVDGVFVKDCDTPEQAAKRAEHEQALEKHVFSGTEAREQELRDAAKQAERQLRLLADQQPQICDEGQATIHNIASRLADAVSYVGKDQDDDLDEPLGEQQPCTDGVCDSCQ